MTNIEIDVDELWRADIRGYSGLRRLHTGHG
jgi:hypothetical protein